MSIDATSKDSKKPNHFKWSDLLSHPLLLLLLGAVLTSYLIPDLTRTWQDHQKALDLKATLVNQMNQDSESVFIELESVEYRFEYIAVGKNQSSIDALQIRFIDELHNWRVNGETIEAQLQVYFDPSSNLATNWQRFASALSYFYYLSIDQIDSERNNYIASIDRLLGELNYNVSSDTEYLSIYVKQPQYGDNLLHIVDENSWSDLERILRDKVRNGLVQLLISSPINIQDSST